MQQPKKHHHTFSCDETKVTVPPPAYNTHQAPPPCYESHGVVVMPPMTSEQEEDSWSVAMHQSFFKRWAYLFRSWRHVFQQGRWVVYACLSCLLLLIIILVAVIVFIMPSYASP